MASVAVMASRQQIVSVKLIESATALAQTLKIDPPLTPNIHRMPQRQMREILLLESIQDFLERANRVTRGEPETLPPEETKPEPVPVTVNDYDPVDDGAISKLLEDNEKQIHQLEGFKKPKTRQDAVNLLVQAQIHPPKPPPVPYNYTPDMYAGLSADKLNALLKEHDQAVKALDNYAPPKSKAESIDLLIRADVAPSEEHKTRRAANRSSRK